MKITRFLMTAIVALAASAVCFADDRPIPVEQLPAAAKTFVKEHFPENTIVYAKIDAQGNWIQVDCHYKAVPAVLVPQAIAAYVQSKFPEVAITKISRKWYGYEVELLSDLDLRFDKEGAFIGYDD